MPVSYTHLDVYKRQARGQTVHPRHFQETIDALLYSSDRSENYHYPVKYVQLSWSEYYAIRILWACAPDILVEVMEARIEAMDPQALDPSDVALAALSQAPVSYTHLDVYKRQPHESSQLLCATEAPSGLAVPLAPGPPSLPAAEMGAT